MALLPRLISASVGIADHAGKIIREIMSKGDLGIVAKEVNFKCFFWGGLT